MKVTATEFQQRVGYYLNLAEHGETIEIEKLKPTKSLYELKPKKDSHVEDRNIPDNKWSKILDDIDANGGFSFSPEEDPVKFTRKVRS